MHFLYSADVLEEDVYRKLKCINFRINIPRLVPAANQQQKCDNLNFVVAYWQQLLPVD